MRHILVTIALSTYLLDLGFVLRRLLGHPRDLSIRHVGLRFSEEPPDSIQRYTPSGLLPLLIDIFEFVIDRQHILA